MPTKDITEIRTFRVLRGQSRVPRAERDTWPESLPWDVVEPWRAQAESNHSQTLDVLDSRGGLAPEELWCAAHGHNLCRIRDITESAAGAWLIQLVAARAAAADAQRNGHRAMTDLFDRLKGEISVFDAETTVYDLAQVRALATRCIDLGRGAVLAVEVGSEYADYVSFVVLEASYGPTTRDGVEVEGAKLEIVFHGCGFSGVLREVRHSSWGENGEGYMHSPPGRVIVGALNALQEWFDLGLDP